MQPSDLKLRLRALSTQLTLEALEGSKALFAPLHECEPYSAVSLTRDLSYGPNARHRLDVFAPEGDRTRPLPVIVFAHGGGFVGGDKKQPGTPYHDNVALWAARRGMIGVNMTYRLAPEFTWPAGAEDTARALAWLRGHAADHGIDPERIFLFGTSAGAVHAASYVAHPEFHPAASPGVAGAILASGIYNLESAKPNQLTTVYFGEDPSAFRACSSVVGLAETEVPLLVTLAEHDPYLFRQQALDLINRFFERRGRFPRFLLLAGHNHFSSTLHLNTSDDVFGQQIVDFVAGCSAPVA